MSIVNEAKEKDVNKKIKVEHLSEEVKNLEYVKEITNFGSSKLTSEQKKKASEMIETARKADAKIVKGIFKNIECAGGDLHFAYHAYKGEPTRVYHLLDGKQYDLPVGVAKHINRQCKYKRSKHLVDRDGSRMITADKPIERYQFVSTEFM